MKEKNRFWWLRTKEEIYYLFWTRNEMTSPQRPASWLHGQFFQFLRSGAYSVSPQSGTIPPLKSKCLRQCWILIFQLKKSTGTSWCNGVGAFDSDKIYSFVLDVLDFQEIMDDNSVLGCISTDLSIQHFVPVWAVWIWLPHLIRILWQDMEVKGCFQSTSLKTHKKKKKLFCITFQHLPQNKGVYLMSIIFSWICYVEKMVSV